MWDKASEVWQNWCPYYRRRLITKHNMVKWIKSLEILDRIIPDTHIYTFFLFLEESEIIHPIGFSDERALVYRPIDIERYDPNKKQDTYYHPLVFFDVLRWILHLTHSSNLFFELYWSIEVKKTSESKNFDSNFLEYFSLRNLQHEIQTKRDLIDYEIKQNQYTEYNQKCLKRLEDQLNTLSYKDRIYPKGKELFQSFKLGFTSNLIDEETLSIWIKLESLDFIHSAEIYCEEKFDLMFDLPYDYYWFRERNKEEIDKMIQKYEDWRKEKFNYGQNYLNSDERKKIAHFTRMLHPFHFVGIPSSFKGDGKWDDFIDICPKSKLDTIIGYTSLEINLIAFRRYITRCYWKLFSKNINYGQETDDCPYFYHESTESEEFKTYFDGIQLDFGLVRVNPFILYVEGETEATIINEYLNHQSIKFRVENVQSVDKLPYFCKLTEDQKDKDYFFFADYHNHSKYKEIEFKLRANGAIFYPDFVTENFTVEQFLSAVFNWFREKEMNAFIKELQDQLINILNDEKKQSDELIQIISPNNPGPGLNYKGFEKSFIGFIIHNFSAEEITQLFYSSHDNSITKQYYTEKDIEKDVKTEIGRKLAFELSQVFTKKDRIKFPFELKLEPFYSKIMDKLNFRSRYWLENHP